MTAAERLVGRLERVRERGDGRWSAACPGPLHKRGDRSGGLGILKVDDRVLIHCPAGCSAADIVAAVGLSLGDLFERPLPSTVVPPVRQPPFPMQMAQAILHYATVVALAADDLRHGKPLNDADFITVVASLRALDAIVMQAATWPKVDRS